MFKEMISIMINNNILYLLILYVQFIKKVL